MNSNSITNTQTKNRRAFIWSNVIFLSYIASVLFLCLANFSSLEIDLEPIKYIFGIRLDKVVHFLMFVPFTTVCWFFLKYSIRLKVPNIVLFVIVLVLGYMFAMAAEYSQGFFTTYRTFDPADLVSNFYGISTGAIIFLAGCLVYKLATHK